MKKILQAMLGKTLALCVFLVLFVVFFHFKPIPESPKPDKESPSADVGNYASPQITPPKDSPLSNSFPANQAVTSVVSPASEVKLRGKTEEKEMRLRHENALKSLGLPPVNNALPRRPLAKEPLVQPPGFEHQLLVKFQDTLLARASREGGLIISSDHVDSQLMQIIREHGLRFKPNHTVGELDLARLEAEALFATREQPADLGGMLQVMPTRSDKDSVWSAAKALQSLGVIEFVSLSSMDQPPPPPQAFDITPPTDALSSTQTYRGSAGINIDEAWSQFGAKGANVCVTDCEYYFNPNHEDLAGAVSPQPGVNSYYTGFGDDHGTAVLGILAAADNNYGMTGMVPQATVRFYPEYSTVNGRSQSRSACITAALIASSRGDVVLLEMQTWGAGATDADVRYVPAEYDQTVWTVVKTGTDAGKHVVAAAGNGGINGGENLDSTAYSTYRNRGDSGSIIVGAADSSRARLSYSTYGARVNLQGWGAWNVATLGYGNYRTYGSDHNQKYTNSFSGTSSASPIVTAAVVAVESVARQRLGRSLTPSEMRQLLAQTGKPQTGDLSTKIGPLPNVTSAIASMLGVAIQRTLTLSAVNGSIQANPAKSTYNDNEAVTLTALPNTGYEFIAWSGDLGGITNPAGLVMSSNRTVSALFAPIFGSVALSPTGLTFTRGGNGAWFMQSVVKPTNIDAAARSGNTDTNSTSWFETSVAGPGTLRYWRKVSSESGYDFLRVFLDGIQIDGASWSGEQDWSQQTVSIPAGNHTVRWQYSKDGSVNNGLDAAFIAQVVYENASATPPPDLFIRSLGTTNATVVDHTLLTGDDRGGIALSENRVFVNGDESTARFNLADLGGGMSLGRRLDGLCSDLETRTVYTLALDGVPYDSGGTVVNQLIQLDGTTGNLTSTVIPLSSPVTLSSNAVNGIFSGRGRVLIHNGSRVYDVRLPSGVVLDLGVMSKPDWRSSENFAAWGVAESFEGSLYLAYRSSSGTSLNSFVRSRVPDGVTEIISNFTDLGDLASWSVDLATNRWFFHYEGGTQFGGGIQTLGFASGNFGTLRSVPIIQNPMPASGMVGSSFSYQILASHGPTFYSSGFLPAGLSLNATTGLISGTPTTAGNSTVTLSASNSAGTGNATLLISIAPPIPVITSATNANGTLGSNFSYQITATNSPTSFWASGLPAGLTLNATSGLISGTPTTAGNSTVTLSATNSTGTGNAALFISIVPGPPIINSATAANGTVGTAFSYQITATNNPTSFAASGLPSGLAINSSTGAISGIPIAAGNFSINASATNSGGTTNRMLSFNITKGVQSISGVTPFQSRLIGAAPYSLNATINSGLAISYTSSNTSVATISANGMVSILGAGTATLIATHDGDANWNPAPSVSQILTVTALIVPSLSVSPSSLGDFTTPSGTPSESLKFNVSGANLEGAVNIVAPAGYEISRDGVSYSSSLVMNPEPPMIAQDSASNYGNTGANSWVNGSNRGIGFLPWAFDVTNNPPNFYAGTFLGDPAAAQITNMPSPAFGLYANPGNTAASVTVSRSFAQPLAVGDSLSFQWATNWDSDVGNKGFNIFAGGVEVVNINQAGFPGNITCNGQLAIDGASGYGTSPMTWTFTRTSPTNLQVSSTARNGTPVLAFSTNITISAAPSGFSFYATAMAAGNDQRQPYFNHFRIVSSTVTGGNMTNTPIFVRLSADAPIGPVLGNITVSSTNATQQTVALSGSVAIPRTIIVTPQGPISLNTIFNRASSATPVAVTGTNLSSNITATAPTNFEVSTNNSSFGSTATLLPAGGNLFLRIASTAPVGLLSGNLSLFSGEASQTLVLLGTVVSSGFDAWPLLLDLPAGRRGMLNRNGPQDLPNLLAYAMGLNPLIATASDLPFTGNFNAASRTIDFTYRRAKNLPDVTLNVEGSSSLTSGFTSATVASEAVLLDGADHQTIRATISVPAGATRYFLRLRANGLQ